MMPWWSISRPDDLIFSAWPLLRKRNASFRSSAILAAFPSFETLKLMKPAFLTEFGSRPFARAPVSVSYTHLQATVHAGQLEGYAKNSQAQKDADALSKLHFDQQRANAAALAETINTSAEAQKAGLHITPEALKGQYDQQQHDAQATHLAQRQAADAAQSRSDTAAVTTAQNAATNSHLAGVALIRSQEQQAIEAAKGGIREIAAIREKYDQQVLDKIAEEQFATEKIQQTAAQAGLTGVAKIRAEGNERVTDLWANPANRAVPDEEKQKRALALEQQTDAEILDAHGQFNQQMADLSMRCLLYTSRCV